MLKKRLGINAIERNWTMGKNSSNCFKIPSTLIIPEGCWEIGIAAFYGCWWLEEVRIPGSVDWIWSSAFEDCFRATVILEKPKREFMYIADDTFEGV